MKHRTTARAALFLLALCNLTLGAPAPGESADMPPQTWTQPGGGARMEYRENSKVERATLFLSGAELTRTMRIALQPGRNTVIFGNLPPDVSPESIRAGVTDGAQLLSAIYRIDNLESPEGKSRIKELNDRLTATDEEIARIASQIAVLDAEEDFLKQNRSIAGDTGIRLEDLRDIAHYYRTRLSEIAFDKIAAKKSLDEQQKQRDRLAKELGDNVDDGTKSVGEIVVEIASERASRADVTVSYFLHSAGWTPFYEIRASGPDTPVKLVGKGKIRQTTGEDWDDIPIVLSSGTPAIGGEQPELIPWYLNFDAPVAAHRAAYGVADSLVMQEPAAPSMSAIPSMRAPSKLAPRVQAQQAQTSIEFVLPSPVSVPSQEDDYTVEIMNEDLPATYRHYSVRKLDRDTFLLAQIDGWEKLNLLEGPVSIFLGNTYVGATYLDPRRADDTLEISLGRDPGVIVTRVKGRDFASRSLLGRNNKVTREWLITVRNTRQTPIDIKVLDQIPVPTDKSIVVEAVETGGATYDAERGELSWELRLEPGESAQKSVKYMVTYPAHRSITLE